MSLPANHPQRRILNDEVHARPPDALATPSCSSYLALASDRAAVDREWALVNELAERHGKPALPGPEKHYSADLGPFRLKWERHTEFTRYNFIVQGGGAGDSDTPSFEEPALDRVPEDWLAKLPGELMVAAHVLVLPAGDEPPDFERISNGMFAGNVLIGSAVAGEAAIALTDFRIRDDGFSRLLLLNRRMKRQQTGRMMQRLLEIDTYRVMALLALPLAVELGPFLREREQALAEIAEALAADDEDKDEPSLLDHLTRVEADISSNEARNHYRFGAADAYYQLVQRRIAELRETRLPDLQTFQEFNQRRLAPAMNTCLSVAGRQQSLARRLARTTQLLSTRVDIARQRQNQALLESMNRRAQLQLRLQQTVEGLSIAAVTYYVVGLVGYAADGMRAFGIDLNTNLVMALSIPVVALLVAASVSRVRRLVRSSGHD